MAPEILKKDGNGYDHMIDWWALGVMIYEMLTSKNPIKDGVADENKIKLFKFRKWEPSNDARDLIKKLLQKNPKERLGSNGV